MQISRGGDSRSATASVSTAATPLASGFATAVLSAYRRLHPSGNGKVGVDDWLQLMAIVTASYGVSLAPDQLRALFDAANAMEEDGGNAGTVDVHQVASMPSLARYFDMLQQSSVAQAHAQAVAQAQAHAQAVALTQYHQQQQQHQQHRQWQQRLLMMQHGAAHAPASSQATHQPQTSPPPQPQPCSNDACAAAPAAAAAAQQAGSAASSTTGAGGGVRSLGGTSIKRRLLASTGLGSSRGGAPDAVPMSKGRAAASASSGASGSKPPATARGSARSSLKDVSLIAAAAFSLSTSTTATTSGSKALLPARAGRRATKRATPAG